MADLSVERQGHIAIVTLDRPPVNAVHNGTHAEIRDIFRSFEEDRDVRVVVFTAAGKRAFMGGADLHAIGEKPDPAAIPATLLLDRGRIARDAMWAIVDCPVPVICAVNGHAIGAGLAYASCCDIILAAENAKFGTTEINVGLLGASAHLAMLVGRHKARELFFIGEMISVEELHRLGAIRKVVPHENLMDEALELAHILAKKSPMAMRLAKESMNRTEGLPLKDAYRTEQDYTIRLLGFDDSTEARNAFIEKREPDFKWR